ncbi:MAG: murein L,D-transpeptidase catalytic domain family protein [Rhizobacter sp.]|nr:murein L,D-transpeptidase catalytic domain family protein [Bacteriovorax sp.]
MKPLKLLRIFSIFITFTFLFTHYAHASGAKRPDVTSPAQDVTDSSDIQGRIPPAGDSFSESPVLEKYSYLDPDHSVPSALLKKALEYFEANQSKISNKRYIVIIDFSQHNSRKRFYLIDMESGDVIGYLTAHGKNSDPDFDGYATQFSNVPDSLMSSVGFYLTAETYYGEHGYSLRLDGLSSTNSNARARAIVIHGADYVTDAKLIGRSYGCPALDQRYYADVINMIKSGALIYAQ